MIRGRAREALAACRDILSHARSASWRGLLTLLGAVGIWLYSAFHLRGSPFPAPWALSAVGALFVVAGVLDLSGRIAGRARGARAIGGGFAIAWPAWIPLGLLPLAAWTPGLSPGLRSGLALALLACSTIALVVRTRETGVSLAARRLRGPGRGGAGGSILGAWEIGLLVLTLMVGALYLQIAAAGRGNLQNDSAYYFGVARHMARTGRFEEPIVWHFLHPPDTVAHAPFDYWGGLTSLVLVPFLRLFGATQQVAFLVMAGVSALSLVAFWHLVCVARAVRSAPAQVVALVAFAFAPVGAAFRFDTESLPLFHLLLILSLIGLFTRRPLLAAVPGCLLFWTRADGLLVGTALVIVTILLLRDRRRRLFAIGAFTGLAALFAARNYLAFGTITPPGASAAPWVSDQLDLYSLHAPKPDIPRALRARLHLAYLADRWGAVRHAVATEGLVPAQTLFPFLLMASLVRAASNRFSRFARRARDLHPARAASEGGPARATSTPPLVVHALALVLPAAVVWLSGPQLHSWRTLSAFLPLFVLSMATGLADLLELLAFPRWSRRLHRLVPLVPATAALAFAYALFSETFVYGPRMPAAMLGRERALRKLDERLAGDTLLATEPWYAMAQTRSPVVSIPEDGEQALIEAIDRWDARWIVIVYDYHYMRRTTRVLEQIERGERDRLGPYVVTPIDAPGRLRVFALGRPGEHRP